MRTRSPILEVRGLSKRFGSLRAVDGLDFEVHSGELVGIAGPNGAGKSTMFNLLSATPYQCTSGTIIFDGRRIERASPRRICRAGLARTFQSEAVFDTLTASENVQVAARFGGGEGRGARRDVEEALELVALGDCAALLAADLSLDQKKRLMLASALACKPRLLLLDEPASGLDEVEQKTLIALIRRISDGGVGIVIIEHVLPLLTAVAERLLIMAAGRQLATGSPTEVLKDEQVVEAYVGGAAR